MRELLSSILRFFNATSLFGVHQMASGVLPAYGNPVDGFQQVAQAAAAELTGPLRELYEAGARLQDGLGDAPPSAPSATKGPDSEVSQPLRRVDSGSLNSSKFVVLGEGLAAGMGDFSLASDTQVNSFPAQMARQMGVVHPQRLIQPPGIGNTPGFAELPVIIPSPLQDTVVDRIPPEQPANLAVPGYTVADAIRRRPTQPLVNKEDCKQTLANFILGLNDIAYGKEGQLGTQLEYALQQRPTFALLELGFTEAIEAAISGRPEAMPSVDSFQEDYSAIVRKLRESGAAVLALSIPDPFDTAHFSSMAGAATVVKVDADLLQELWQIRPDDFVTTNGLNEIAFQILAASIRPLPAGSTLSAEFASRIRHRVQEFNEAIRRTAEATGAWVYDLNGFFQRVHESGVAIGSRRLTGGYLGGFYCLNGYYPGAVGHALIANEILQELNRRYGAHFELIDAASLIASDPVVGYKPAGGPNWTSAVLREAARSATNSNPEASSTSKITQSIKSGNGKRNLGPLKLPPRLEQVLPINKELSYFGDGISALNCRTPQAIQFGSDGNLLFGGLAMVDSHLSGNIRVKFSPPVNGNVKFQIFFEGGFTGEDEVLQAPRFFKMPFRQNRVDEMPGMISSGTLNLETGDVDTSKGALNIFAIYRSTALNALVSVNPMFPWPPKQPLAFPGQYGSACLKFDQRPDGLLDLTFVGSTFVPLGNGTAWPLNFAGPSLDFATVPANGTVMHPHLALCTRETEPAEQRVESPEVPFNTVQEYSLFAPISSFGDIFTLNAPQLAGPATGRSRLLGRIQIQFGPRCGNSVPVAVATTTAGGTLAAMDPTPLSGLFPGRLTPGPLGFYENLRFPLRTYSLNDLAIIDDPFDLSIGSIDLRAGKFTHPLLHRGFINQDLIFALIRVEPRTPQNSFMFRGAAELLKTRGAPPAFQFYGQVHIPYPPGFLFPDPNLATGFPIEGDSALDPYLWFWAIPDVSVPDRVVTGGGEAVSSRFEQFNYRFEIPTRPNRQEAVFEYENLSQNGKFHMHSLAWVSFANSKTDPANEGEFDTLTFTGFGVWSKNDIDVVEQVSVQISTSARARYVGIQIGLGDVSNVNTPMPPDAFPVRKAEAGGYECCIGLPGQPSSRSGVPST